MCQRFLLAHSVPAAWGEPARPGFPPEGETGKGEFRLPCRRQFARAWRRWQARRWFIVCSLSYHVFLQIPVTNLYVDPLDPLSRSLAGATHCLPCFYPHSEWAAFAARCKLGFDLKPRSITTVTDLGCWVLPSTRRSLKDQGV